MAIVAVVQHELLGDPGQDAASLLDACRVAAEQGAHLVLLPETPSLAGDPGGRQSQLVAELEALPGVRLLPSFECDVHGFAGIVSAPEGLEALSTFGLLVGDACFDESELARLAAADPDIAIMMPRSESELQAEAVLEVALALSDSLAGVVLVVEAYGAELGEPGHGGSAIVRLGEIVLEAGDGPDLLVAGIDTPVARPEPKEPLPQIPPILSQRVATHRGVRPIVDYPADLSDGFLPA